MIRKLTLSQQSALNIVGSVGVVLINAGINLVLSPYIVRHLGISANGYITLANNFVSYIGLVTIALNSMSGRFILVEYRRHNMRAANEYYSSVLFGDWMLCAIIVPAMVLFLVFINQIINVSVSNIGDIRLLFGIIFANYLLHLCLPQWQTAPYCTNNLYLRSLRNIVSSITRALAIFLLFKFFVAHAYYVAIAGSVMTLISLSMDYWFYRALMPELTVKFQYFRWNKVKALISSGMWNTVSQCGALLLEGLDILITNIFINPVAAGMMAVSKVLPNMINQLSGNMATTFGPHLTYLFADGNMPGLAKEVKNNIKVISILANVPIGIFAVYGSHFFKLWMPGEDSTTLWILSTLALCGVVFTGIGQCMTNIFGVVNRLKWNSLVIVFSGVLSISMVLLSLKFTNWGVLGIAGISAFVSIVRTLLFTIPYSAYCIGMPIGYFYMSSLGGALNISIPVVIAIVASKFFPIDSWFSFFIVVGIVALVSYIVDCIFILDKSQRKTFFRLMRIRK